MTEGRNWKKWEYSWCCCSMSFLLTGGNVHFCRWLFNRRPQPFRASHRRNASPSVWPWCIQIGLIMLVILHVEHANYSVIAARDVGDGDLRRRRDELIKSDLSHASQLLWSCTSFDSHEETWWHLYRGAPPIWFACFQKGQPNLIFQTGLNQRCLLNWISALESWEQILKGWLMRDQWDRFSGTKTLYITQYLHDLCDTNLTVSQLIFWRSSVEFFWRSIADYVPRFMACLWHHHIPTFLLATLGSAHEPECSWKVSFLKIFGEIPAVAPDKLVNEDGS